MKYSASIILAFCLTACGGGSSGDNPSEAPLVQSDPMTAPTDGIDNDTTASDPLTGECVDFAPLNDGIGWNGVSECALPIQQTQPEQSTPATPPESTVVQVPAGFSSEGGSVLGNWFCASTNDATNTWQLNFANDQTVILQDGSNTVSSWWYSDQGVVVQWSHTGLTANYVLQSSGGIMDGGSFCSRQPVTVVVEQPEPPLIVNLETGVQVSLQRPDFRPGQFDSNGLLWECVARQYGANGDFYSYLSGATAALHYDTGKSDLLLNSNGGTTTVERNLDWSIEGGIYFGPLPLNGVEWVEKENDTSYSIWLDDSSRFDCYERASITLPPQQVTVDSNLTTYECFTGPDEFVLKLDLNGTQAEVRGEVATYTIAIDQQNQRILTVLSESYSLFLRDFRGNLTYIGDPGASGSFGTNCYQLTESGERVNG